MDDVTTIERKPNVAIDNAVVFSMRNTPLLQQGTIYDPLATAENLWVNLKVYASGGENALHSHGGEDHASSFCRARPPSPSATAAPRLSGNMKA